MAACRDFAHARKGYTVPTEGLCIAGRKEMGEEETTSGTASAAAPGKSINLSASACEKFEPKKSRKEMIREGY